MRILSLITFFLVPSSGGLQNFCELICVIGGSQTFVQAQASIFTNFKANDLLEIKILLFFIEDGDTIRRWVVIEERYMKGIVPNSHGFIDVSENARRKLLVQNDLKPLYGLRTKDIDHPTNSVEVGKVCIKSLVAKRGDKSTTMITLMVARQLEKLIKAMKNKFICHYENHELLCFEYSPDRKPQ